MSGRKAVFINGPPGSGKDTAGIEVRERCGGRRLKFADPLKVGTHSTYGLGELPPDHFDAVKNEPRPEFFGLSPRRAYIIHSEHYMKPVHGSDIFGRIALRHMMAFKHGLFVISDSGFVDEAMPIVKEIGAENCFLIRLHREDCDFSNDSRSYIELPVKTLDVDNVDIDEFRAEMSTHVSTWLLDTP